MTNTDSLFDEPLPDVEPTQSTQPARSGAQQGPGGPKRWKVPKPSMLRRPQQPKGGRWWEEAEEVPRAGLPDAKRLERRAKIYRRFVLASVVLTPFLILVAIVLAANLLSDDEQAAPKAQIPYAETKADAIIEVRRWLGQDPSPFPGGVLVGWDSADSKKAPDPDGTAGKDYHIEVHRLTIAASNGALYDTTVTLGVSDSIGSYVLGEPTLVARAPSVTTFAGTPWPDALDYPAPDAVASAVTTWAEAYSSGDPNALRIAVQDTSSTHSYMPLSGASLSNGEITESAGVWPSGTTEEERTSSDPPKMLIQATFDIKWKGQKKRNDESPATVTYDLLVTKADTAAPVVVAWGGAGTGPSLKEYGNAVTGRGIDTDSDDTGDDTTLSDDPTPLPDDDSTDTGSTDTGDSGDGTEKGTTSKGSQSGRDKRKSKSKSTGKEKSR